MVLDIPFVANLQAIEQRRQQIVNCNLVAANCQRFSYDYQPGDMVLKLTYKPDKLEPRAEGPYEVVSVHTNGMLTIRLTPHVMERLSIRHVKPFRQ